jgi:hypothetical protein
MNCTEFEERLMQAVEDRQSLEPFEEESGPGSLLWQELRARANACEHCRKLWNEFALLDRVLPVWKSQLPPVDLADRVMARWREEQTAANPSSAVANTNGQKRTTWRFPFSMILAVAVAVLAAIPFVFPPPSDPDLPKTGTISHLEPVSADGTLPVPEAHVAAEPSAVTDWQALAQDAGSAYWALASDAADSFASVTDFVPPRKAAIETEKPQQPEPSTGWVEGIGSGLKPIGQDVKKSMGFLFEALPSEPPTI